MYNVIYREQRRSLYNDKIGIRHIVIIWWRLFCYNKEDFCSQMKIMLMCFAFIINGGQILWIIQGKKYWSLFAKVM
jgi:hypothetical protein